MDNEDLIQFLRSMSRMQAEMPEQYAKLLAVIASARENAVDCIINAEEQVMLYRFQGAIGALDELLEKISTPMQDLNRLEKG
tara:strand:- start:171809 stop:172054 length:246 start_codon:yes stop_codon:yes gene_type:complete